MREALDGARKEHTPGLEHNLPPAQAQERTQAFHVDGMKAGLEARRFLFAPLAQLGKDIALKSVARPSSLQGLN
jgi:hypothetical protein